MISRIEVIVDAVGKLNGIHNPESEAYLLRNPLLLKSYAKPGRHEINSEGIRTFGLLLAGYKAAVFDVELKLKGLSRAGLKPTDALENLLGCYGIYEKLPKDNVVSFLRRALKDQSVSLKTHLSYFLENDNG